MPEKLLPHRPHSTRCCGGCWCWWGCWWGCGGGTEGAGACRADGGGRSGAGETGELEEASGERGKVERSTWVGDEEAEEVGTGGMTGGGLDGKRSGRERGGFGKECKAAERPGLRAAGSSWQTSLVMSMAGEGEGVGGEAGVGRNG